jgi:hypothetical protein
MNFTMKTQYLITTALLASGILSAAPAFAGSRIMPGGRSMSAMRANDFARTPFTAERGNLFSQTAVGKPRPGISVDDGKGGWKPYVPPAKSNVIGSSTYGGKTTTVTKNPDGSHTVSVTDENGRTSSTVHGPSLPGISVDDGKGGWKPYVPPAKSNVIGSTTFDGKTTTVTLNPDGSHTVSVTDENGNTTSTLHPAVK